MNKKYLAIIVLAFLGIINAAYLSHQAYLALNPDMLSFLNGSFCDINETFSCTNFLAQPESRVFGIPFPWIAAVVYPVLFVLALIGNAKKSVCLTKTIMILAFCGLAFNGYVIYNEATIGVFCPLCMMCTGYIVTIGILAALILKNKELK
jgi:vitamin K epoxide reductase family